MISTTGRWEAVRISVRPTGAVASWTPSWRRGRDGGVPQMADVAYVLVFAGGFVLLALVLRGLERL